MTYGERISQRLVGGWTCEDTTKGNSEESIKVAEGDCGAGAGDNRVHPTPDSIPSPRSRLLLWVPGESFRSLLPHVTLQLHS